MDEVTFLDSIEKSITPKPSASGASLAGTDPVFAAKISALLDEAARQGRRLTIGNAKRDLATQARLRKRYETDPNAPLAARPTPHAPHVRGVAADLEGDLAWAHENAPRFGLYFPLLNAKGRHREDWHIQLDERGGAPSSGLDEESFLNSIEQSIAPRKEVGFGYQNQPVVPRVESPRREVGYGAQNQSPFAGARATGQLTTNTRNAGYGSQDQKPRVQLNDPITKGAQRKRFDPFASPLDANAGADYAALAKRGIVRTDPRSLGASQIPGLKLNTTPRNRTTGFSAGPEPRVTDSIGPRGDRTQEFKDAMAIVAMGPGGLHGKVPGGREHEVYQQAIDRLRDINTANAVESVDSPAAKWLLGHAAGLQGGIATAIPSLVNTLGKMSNNQDMTFEDYMNQAGIAGSMLLPTSVLSGPLTKLLGISDEAFSTLGEQGIKSAVKAATSPVKAATTVGRSMRNAGLRKLTKKVGEEEALKLAAKSGDVEAGIQQIVNEANAASTVTPRPAAPEPTAPSTSTVAAQQPSPRTVGDIAVPDHLDAHPPLPRTLASAKPRWKTTELTFERDVDRVAYILANDAKSGASRSAEKYRQWAIENGYDVAELVAHGRQLRANLKGAIKDGTATYTVKAPRQAKLSDAFDAQPLPRKPSEFVAIRLSEDPGDVFDITDFNRPVENYLTSEGNVSILNSAERRSIHNMHPKQAETALPQVQEIIDSITASNGRAKPGNTNKLKRLTEVKKALEQKAAQYGEQFPGATTNETAAQAMADSLAIPKMTPDEFDAYYNGLASLSEREKALKIRQAGKNAPRPKPTPGGRSGAAQKVDAEDVKLAARLAAVKMGRAVEDGEVMHNVRSAIRAMRLLSVGNRILDLTSNTVNLGGQLIGKTGVNGWSVDRAVHAALFPKTVQERGPATVAIGIKEINDWRKNAPQRIWQELKDLITTGNTEELHKFGITREAGGPLKYIGRATGSTDLIFRDFYRHMAELEIEKMMANPKIAAIMTPEMRKLIIDEAELTGVFANDSWALGTMAKDAQGNYNNRLPMTGKGAVAQVHDIVNGERAVKGHLLGRKTSVDTKRIVERIPPDVSAAAKRATVANAGKIKGLLDGTIPFSQVQASTEAMREALKAAGFNNRGMVVYRVARKGEEEGARLVYSTRPSYLVAGMGEGDTLMRATIQPSDAGAIMHDGESLIFVVERPTLVVDRWSKEMRNAVMIVGDQVVPFPKVIANVAGTNTDYAFGAVKALIRRANVKELTIHDERVITELVRKNLVGVGTMLAGGYLYDKGYIKPVIDPNTHRATFGPVVAQGFGWAGWMLLAGATMAAYNDESLFPKKKKSSYDNPTGGVTADDAMQTAWNVGADMADSSAAGAVGMVGDMMRGDRAPELIAKTAGKLISNAAPAFMRSHAKQGYPDIPGQEPKDVWDRLKKEGLGWLSLDNSVDYRQPRGFSESANMWDKSAVMKMKMGGLPHPALGQYGVGYRELSRQTWEPEDKYIERTLKARQVVNKLVDDTVKSKEFKSMPKDRQADLLLKIVTRVREVFGESARDTYGKK